MPNLSSHKIITNRQLNFTLAPVDLHNPKQMPYKMQSFEIHGTWNQHQSIILDALLDALFRTCYRRFKKLPKSWRSKKVIETIERFSNGKINPDSLSQISLSLIDAYSQHVGYDVRENLKLQYDNDLNLTTRMPFEKSLQLYQEKNPDIQAFMRTRAQNAEGLNNDMSARFNLADLFENYSFLQKYRYTLIDYLRRIEQTRFKMTYKVKYMHRKPVYDSANKMTDKGLLIDIDYPMPEFQSIFEVSSVEKNRIVLNFKSPLGKLILHNTFILDTDWCPVEVTALSKNAYFIYKRFLLNKVQGRSKAKSIRLKLEDLKSFLDLTWSNDRGVHAIIEKTLRCMLQNRLIAGYRVSKNLIKERIYHLQIENVGKELPEKQMDDDRILRFSDYK